MRWMVGEKEEEEEEEVEVEEEEELAMAIPTCCECSHMHSGHSQRVRQLKPAGGTVTHAHERNYIVRLTTGGLRSKGNPGC